MKFTHEARELTKIEFPNAAINGCLSVNEFIHVCVTEQLTSISGTACSMARTQAAPTAMEKNPVLRIKIRRLHIATISLLLLLFH